MPKRRKLQRPPMRPQKQGPQKPQTKPKTHHQQHHNQQQIIIPFKPHDRILLIGEGDLSFAASLIQHHGCTNVTATVLEKDHAELVAKYPSVDANISIIKGTTPLTTTTTTAAAAATATATATTTNDDDAATAADDGDDDKEEEEEEEVNDDDEEEGGKEKQRVVNNRLIYNIDATKPLPPSLSRTPHDHIIFNFPHVGGKSTDINRQVRHNQDLLVSFFRTVLSPRHPPLAPGGDVVVTIFEAEPYTLWNIRDLARHAGLHVDRSYRFRPDAYPGYAHARTFGVVKARNGGGRAAADPWRGEDRAARSYVFVRRDEMRPTPKRKRGDESSDEE